MNISKETFNIYKAYSKMVSAEMYLLDSINSGRVQYQAKALLKKFKMRLDANIKDLRSIIPPESLSVIDEQMLNPNVVLQNDNIMDMIAELPSGIRDQVESHIEGLYNIYKLNKHDS